MKRLLFCHGGLVKDIIASEEFVLELLDKGNGDNIGTNIGEETTY